MDENPRKSHSKLFPDEYNHDDADDDHDDDDDYDDDDDIDTKGDQSRRPFSALVCWFHFLQILPRAS